MADTAAVDTATQDNQTQNQTQETGAATDTTPNEFAASLGESFAGHEAFKDIGDAQTLATRYAETHTRAAELQAQVEAIPRPPESPDKYTMPDVPEGVKLDDKAVDAWRQEAHKLGMSDEMFKSTMAAQLNMVSQRAAQIKQEHADLMASKQKELGSNWEPSLALVNKVVDKLGLASLLNQGDPTGEKAMLRTNPVVFDALLKIGQAIDTDKLPGAAGPGSSNIPRTADGRPMFNYPSMQPKG
jgi:hypothetical protein